jgi:hypothetical protein
MLRWISVVLRGGAVEFWDDTRRKLPIMAKIAIDGNDLMVAATVDAVTVNLRERGERKY